MIPQYDESSIKLKKARAKLVLNFPFLSVLALNLELKEENVETCSTDGKYIFYNKKFISERNLDDVMFIMAHEAMHCALGHHTRRGTRNFKLWNDAADYTINYHLKETLKYAPEGTLLNPAFNGKSAEEIYDILNKQEKGKEKEKKKEDGKATPDPSTWGQVLDNPKNSQETGEEAWKEKMSSAYKVSQKAGQDSYKAGDMSQGLEKLVKEILSPQQDWRSILRNYMFSISREDYSWRRPNRRMLSQGLYLPSAYSESMGKIVIAVDTSGSVNNELLKEFLSEVQAVVREMDFESITVMQFDTKVNKISEYKKNDEINLEVKGRGGTNYVPLFSAIEEINPELVLIFTDLFCRRFKEDYYMSEVLWFDFDPDSYPLHKGKPPYGVVVNLK